MDRAKKEINLNGRNKDVGGNVFDANIETERNI